MYVWFFPITRCKYRFQLSEASNLIDLCGSHSFTMQKTQFGSEKTFAYVGFEDEEGGLRALKEQDGDPHQKSL